MSPAGGTHFSRVDLGDSARLVLIATPQGRGAFREQAREVLAAMQTVLDRQAESMVVTVLTVFLNDLRDQPECEQLFADFFNSISPVTNYVLQPPCCGASLAIEAWAIGGRSVRVERFGPRTLAVAHDGVRWVYCAGIKAAPTLRAAYPQALDVLEQSRAALARAGSGFQRVVRTWFYLGGITDPEADGQRYQELNRARTDFYRDVRFRCAIGVRSSPGGAGSGSSGSLESADPQLRGDVAAPEDGRTREVYPASTGIGMAGRGLVMSCMALDTRRDVVLLPLENPQQTPAYAYASRYSSPSPKFSRAVALVLDDYVTTWVSGTASIVESETCHTGDPAKQTEQTIENIERLISAENFTGHGLRGAGASLQDLAKIRVYLKRPEDLAKCQAVCERRFGTVPAVYAVADICRPELLVEIEGVAFSRYSPGGAA